MQSIKHLLKNNINNMQLKRNWSHLTMIRIMMNIVLKQVFSDTLHNY